MKTYQDHRSDLADIAACFYGFKMNLVYVYVNLHWDSGGSVSEGALGGSLEEFGSNCLKFKSESSWCWNVNIRFVFINKFKKLITLNI